MANNYKVDDKTRKKVIADYVDNQNKSETARMNNLNEATVRKILKEEDQTLIKIFEEQKEKNTQSTLEYMKEQHQIKKKIVQKILKAIEDKVDNVDMFTNIKDLATAYGIIIDKELKVLELQRGSANNDDLNTVKELLGKLEQEAQK